VKVKLARRKGIQQKCQVHKMKIGIWGIKTKLMRRISVKIQFVVKSKNGNARKVIGFGE
jgi:hypothetical protein